MQTTRLFAIALMISAAFSLQARAEIQSVTIHNETNQAIVDLYADEYADRGELELLDNDTLEAGESTTVEIDSDDDNDCIGDIRAVFEDGSSDEIRDANICDDQDYVFN